MSIATAAKGTPLAKPVTTFQFVDLQTGNLTEHAAQLLNQYRNFIVGMNRLTPCNASGKNVITLTPLDASPLIEKYVDYEIFSFVADQSCDGAVTMTVVPRDGALSTLKAYAMNGAAQATVGDIVAGSLYLAIYVDSLDAAAGGFVLK